MCIYVYARIRIRASFVSLVRACVFVRSCPFFIFVFRILLAVSYALSALHTGRVCRTLLTVVLEGMFFVLVRMCTDGVLQR